MKALELVESWPVETVAVGVVRADGTVAGRHGPTTRSMPLASVTKPLAAYAVLVAVEEGAIALEDYAGPEGSTVRHLLAHASGLRFDERAVQAPPGTRRIYSNAGFEVLGETVEKATGMAFADYLHQAVCVPLGMAGTRLDGSPAKDAVSTVEDLLLLAAELLAPRLLHSSTLAEATHVAFPGLAGVLPGFGRQDPNDWGLGFELRDDKRPHWTGTASSPSTFGHFGRSGTFLWVDPQAGAGCACLTDRDFDTWAGEAWPRLTDAILDELAG